MPVGALRVLLVGSILKYYFVFEYGVSIWISTLVIFDIDLVSTLSLMMESIYQQPLTCEDISKIWVDLKNTACRWNGMSAVI